MLPEEAGYEDVRAWIEANRGRVDERLEDNLDVGAWCEIINEADKPAKPAKRKARQRAKKAKRLF